MVVKVRAITYCFKPFHYEAIKLALPKWLERLAGCEFVVGYLNERADEDFKIWMEQFNGVEFMPIEERISYGSVYNMLISDCERFDFIIVLAPFVVPSKWFLGSSLEWVKSYSLIGHYKPPRVLVAEQLLLPLVAPVIVEMGRINLDCVVVKPDFMIDFSYFEHCFGSVLVRGRPGSMLLFNALSAGCPILALPYQCRTVRYITENDLERKKMRGEVSNADF